MSLCLVVLHFARYGCINDWNLTFLRESLRFHNAWVVMFLCFVLVAVEVSDWRQSEIDLSRIIRYMSMGRCGRSSVCVCMCVCFAVCGI